MKSTEKPPKMYPEDKEKYFMNINIDIYLQGCLNLQKEKEWKDDQITAFIAFAIGHEVFIHAYKKGFICMRAWNANNDNEFFGNAIEQTEHGSKLDHSDYINGKENEGLDLMRKFREELKVSLKNNIMFNEINNYHDKICENLLKPKDDEK